MAAAKFKVIWYRNGVKVTAVQRLKIPWVEKMISQLKLETDLPGDLMVYVVDHDSGTNGGSVHMNWTRNS